MKNSEIVERKAKRSEYMAEYYQQNKAKKNAYSKAYYEENKDIINKRKRAKVYVRKKDIYKILKNNRKMIGDASYLLLVKELDQLNKEVTKI